MGRTASKSPPVNSCFTEDFCSCRSSRLNPRSERKFNAFCKAASNWILALIRSEQIFDRHMSSSRANQALRSLANAGFQNPGVCPQAFPSFPSPSPLFHFLALVSFLARPKPRISFLALSLLRNSTETLAKQAIEGFVRLTIEGDCNCECLLKNVIQSS